MICVFNLGLLQLLQLCGLACVQTEALPSDSGRNRQASLLRHVQSHPKRQKKCFLAGSRQEGCWCRWSDIAMAEVQFDIPMSPSIMCPVRIDWDNSCICFLSRQAHTKHPPINSMVHQRSPMLSTLLPLPKERAHYLAQNHYCRGRDPRPCSCDNLPDFSELFTTKWGAISLHK